MFRLLLFERFFLKKLNALTVSSSSQKRLKIVDEYAFIKGITYFLSSV